MAMQTWFNFGNGLVPSSVTKQGWTRQWQRYFLVTLYVSTDTDMNSSRIITKLHKSNIIYDTIKINASP